MRRLLIHNGVIYQTIGYQLYDENKEYIKSPYLMTEEVDNKLLVYNTLTYELIYLTEEEYTTEKKYLVEHWFLLEKDSDPYSICKMLKQIYRQMRKRKKIDRISTYLILPTTKCNARCSYCYEKDGNKRDMTEDTAKDVINFIKQTRSDKIKLSWFGGEPLYNGKIINFITRQLRENNITYTSSMISNGLLFDKYNIDTIKYLWNLKSVQITLDGTEETYNNTKRCTDKDIENPFEKVLDNIEYLVSNDIQVNIRMNVSETNIEDLKELAKILEKRFSQYSNHFSVYSHPLFDEGNTRAAAAQEKISKGFLEIQQLLIELGLSKKYNLSNIHMCTNCMADSLHTVTINPDGGLGLCEHYYDDVIIGNINSLNFNNDIIHEWQRPLEKEECKTCVLYPRCTKISHCPAGGCTQDSKADLDLQIRTSMKDLYRRIRKDETRENN